MFPLEGNCNSMQVFSENIDRFDCSWQMIFLMIIHVSPSLLNAFIWAILDFRICAIVLSNSLAFIVHCKVTFPYGMMNGSCCPCIAFACCRGYGAPVSSGSCINLPSLFLVALLMSTLRYVGSALFLLGKYGAA